MRIRLVVPSLNPVTGGPSKSAMMEMKGLARLGHQVEVLTTFWPAPSRDSQCTSFEENGVAVRIFPHTPFGPLRHVPNSPSLLRAVRATKNEFDFYVVSSLWNPLATRVMATYRLRKLPYAIICHGMLDPVVFGRHRIGKWLWAKLWERKNVERAQLVHFTSEPEREKARRCKWEIRKSIVKPIALDVSAYRELPPAGQLEYQYPQLANRQVIAFVGRINWVKNLHLLVGALAELKKRGTDAFLLLAGPDSDGQLTLLKAQANELGVSDRLVFTGLLQGEALQSVYARADVVALVSQKENFGLAAAEALCAGVPVVLSDGVDMGHHWPAPPAWRVLQNVKSVADGLAASLAYAQKSAKPSAAARALAEAEWGTSNSQLLSDAYEEALADWGIRGSR